ILRFHQVSPAVAKSGRTPAMTRSRPEQSRSVLLFPRFRGFWETARLHFCGWLSLLTLILLAAVPIRSWAQENVITGINIQGNRRIPADTIKARIFTRAGDVYDQAALERDFNSLWNTGYFEDIRFERQQTTKGIAIIVYVKERPTIREINYTGLNAV